MIIVKFFWANHSFFVSKRANERFALKNEQFAHSVIYHEWPEPIAHSRSIFMSDLGDLLTVAHWSWVIWANRSQLLILSERSEQMSKWAMSEFPTLFILNC